MMIVITSIDKSDKMPFAGVAMAVWIGEGVGDDAHFGREFKLCRPIDGPAIVESEEI